MPRKCPACGKSEEGNPDISFHKLPSDILEKSIWISALNLVDVILPKNAHVCSDHFDPKDILVSTGGRKRVVNGACPIHIPTADDHIESTYSSSDEDKSGSPGVSKQFQDKEEEYYQHESLYNFLLNAGCWKNDRVEIEIVEVPEQFANQLGVFDGNENILNFENKSDNENCLVGRLNPESTDIPEFEELLETENNSESEIKIDVTNYINELIQESELIDPENDPKMSSVVKEKKISSHKTKNNSKKGIRCDLCGFLAKKVIFFKKHVERVHPNFVCKICGYFATKKIYLKQHIRWHKCQPSGFIPTDKKQLEMHTANASPEFKCYLCRFSGDTVSKLQKHVRDVHLND